MASRGIEMGLVLVIVVMLWNGATAQSGCTGVLVGMAPCLNYITGNSSTPSSSCCSQLASVVQSQPQCLCSVLNGGGSSLGITVNQTLALALPAACNVKTPSVSHCNATTPASSPADSTNKTPEIPSTTSESNIPSGAGSKTVPSTDGASSDGSNIKSPLHVVVFLLFVASWASAATRF
ncbi:hypothetical protein F0562_002525 [Nyssa sinensis]|uniref:Bifunctional inhibitor/plant lipid transfer protein/seed storage helical domain-containing protein n=1 Tax=Nyssa sinensis TaxID=561372 RepID=A0A5J5CB19_9ASTE|nr:hypothetical protein F0562_002525 [Nyssa sinensis]